jgi:hypothetical protein
VFCESRKLHVLHGETWQIDDRWRERLAAIGITDDTSWSEFVGDELVSFSGRTTRCYRCALADGESVFFKRYVYAHRAWYDFWMRPAKAAVEWWAYSRLGSLDIPTLEVVAFGERRHLGVLDASCIVTRGIPDRIDLAEFAETVWCSWPRTHRREIAFAIAERLLTQARTAHQNGFFHHDLKWRNVLIAVDGDPGSLVWIDAPRASSMPGRQRRGIVTDLSGLARIAISLFSRSDLMRFLGLYLGPDNDRVARRRLFRDVQAHLGRRMPRPLVLDYPD